MKGDSIFAAFGVIGFWDILDFSFFLIIYIWLLNKSCWLGFRIYPNLTNFSQLPLLSLSQLLSLTWIITTTSYLLFLHPHLPPALWWTQRARGSFKTLSPVQAPVQPSHSSDSLRAKPHLQRGFHCPAPSGPSPLSWLTFYFPLTGSAVAAEAFLFTLEHVKHASASGRSHLLLHLLGTVFSQMPMRFTHSLLLSLCSDVLS